MNYVKHLSIALLVLGTASVFATQPSGATQPPVLVPNPNNNPPAQSVGTWDQLKDLAAKGGAKTKEVFSDYVYGKATWKTQLPIALLVAGGAYGLYKKSARVKDCVDDSLESAGEGLRNIKDGNGTARRDAVLKVGGTGLALYLADAAWNRKFRWIQA